MYGLPAADEMDPTMFVALTYTLIFGAMFGDLGQGALLFIVGGILYLKKKEIWRALFPLPECSQCSLELCTEVCSDLKM